jgi:hypothetical protein
VFDEVLLERHGAEGVADLELPRLTVRAVGSDEEAAVAAEEGAGHPSVREPGVVEVAQDRAIVGLLHGEVVMRAAPQAVLVGVALGAALAADEGRIGRPL